MSAHGHFIAVYPRSRRIRLGSALTSMLTLSHLENGHTFTQESITNALKGRDCFVDHANLAAGAKMRKPLAVGRTATANTYLQAPVIFCRGVCRFDDSMRISINTTEGASGILRFSWTKTVRYPKAGPTPPFGSMKSRTIVCAVEQNGSGISNGPAVR